MNDDKIEMIFEHLRLIRQEISGIKGGMCEIKSQLSSIDNQFALVWGEVTAQSHFVNKKKFCETTESEQKATSAPNKWIKEIANVIGD